MGLALITWLSALFQSIKIPAHKKVELSEICIYWKLHIIVVIATQLKCPTIFKSEGEVGGGGGGGKGS